MTTAVPEWLNDSQTFSHSLTLASSRSLVLFSSLLFSSLLSLTTTTSSSPSSWFAQMANEKWKKAQALQDHIDEERLMEEQAARQDAAGRGDDRNDPGEQDRQGGAGGPRQDGGVGGPSKPLLFEQADPVDGDYFSKLERLVHLDLKGAPPLVSYLERLFPVLKKLGATGLLMEYEDMFPYSGNISVLASDVAYSQSDLARIKAAAKSNGLEIIPLVQTFGHMEFVLKYPRYKDLREHDYTPQVITPVKEESYTLLFNILEQVGGFV